jgi:predicted XRE-type DNA-binding protein
MTDSAMIEVSSGNIFADLDIPNADEYLTKVKLASRIIELIQQTNLPLQEILTLLSLNQDKLNHLMMGELDNFSSEHLFQLLNALDQDIEIIIHPKKSANNKASIKVTVAEIT